jgi:Tfp pilus assembly protein PilX
MTKPTNSAEKGQALITAIIFLLALTFMGFGLIVMSTIDVNSSRNLRLAEEALVSAEQGVFMGLAWAGNTETGFLELAEGDTVHLRSTTNAGRSPWERAQFEVVMTMGGETEAGAGAGTGKSGSEAVAFVYKQVQIQSLGMVSESPRSIFDFTQRPQIKRTVELIAKVKKLK